MDSIWQAVIASAVGVVFTVIARYIDRWLPDPEGKHPLPPNPQVTSQPPV